MDSGPGLHEYCTARRPCRFEHELLAEIVGEIAKHQAKRVIIDMTPSEYPQSLKI